MGKVLPEFLSEWTTERVREEGVNVIPKAQVESVELVNGQLNLKLVDGKNVLCDHVVVAVGSEPNISLAQKSGLEVDSAFGGYLVNAELEARRHLYVVSIPFISAKFELGCFKSFFLFNFRQVMLLAFTIQNWDVDVLSIMIMLLYLVV